MRCCSPGDLKARWTSRRPRQNIQIVHQTGPLRQYQFSGSTGSPTDTQLLFIASLKAEHCCEQAAVKGQGPEASISPPPKQAFFSFQPTLGRSGRRSAALTCPYLVGPESHILRSKIDAKRWIPGRNLAGFLRNLVVRKGQTGFLTGILRRRGESAWVLYPGGPVRRSRRYGCPICHHPLRRENSMSRRKPDPGNRPSFRSTNRSPAA